MSFIDVPHSRRKQARTLHAGSPHFPPTVVGFSAGFFVDYLVGYSAVSFVRVFVRVFVGVFVRIVVRIVFRSGPLLPPHRRPPREESAGRHAAAR